MKLTPPSRGSSQPSQDDLQREAEAELRRAGALGGPSAPRPGAGDSAAYRRGPPPDFDKGPPEDDDHDGLQPWSSQVSAEEESRAITDLALQQFAERGKRPMSAPTRRANGPSLSTPEEMRSRAMAEMLERQQRLARENPVVAKPAITVGARARAAPTLTAAPMVNVARPPGVPRDSGARASLAAMPAATAPVGRRSGILNRNASVMEPNGARPGQRTDDPAGRGTIRPSATRGGPRQVGGDGRRARVRRAQLSTPDPTGGAAEPNAWGNDDALAAASHATLSAIAVLLVSMEVLPAPTLQGEGQAQEYEELTRQMRQLGGLLEQFLGQET